MFKKLQTLFLSGPCPNRPADLFDQSPIPQPMKTGIQNFNGVRHRFAKIRNVYFSMKMGCERGVLVVFLLCKECYRINLFSFNKRAFGYFASYIDSGDILKGLAADEKKN